VLGRPPEYIVAFSPLWFRDLRGRSSYPPQKPSEGADSSMSCPYFLHRCVFLVDFLCPILHVEFFLAIFGCTLTGDPRLFLRNFFCRFVFQFQDRYDSKKSVRPLFATYTGFCQFVCVFVNAMLSFFMSLKSHIFLNSWDVGLKKLVGLLSFSFVAHFLSISREKDTLLATDVRRNTGSPASRCF